MRATSSRVSKESDSSGAVAAKIAQKTAKKSVLKLVKSPANSDGTPTPLQQEALIIKYRIKARKLGRSILRRWHARMELDEVDSIVDLSLCEAVKRFNPYKGASFMTFLFYHLKGNLIRAVTTAAAACSIPTVWEQGEEVAEKGNGDSMGEFQLRGINSAEIAEAVTSQEAPQPDDVLWHKELNDRSSLACEKLDALEREIIKRIFIHEQQIMDIATSLGYSRCHISRIKKKALETLHAELSSSMNNDDLGHRTSIENDSEELGQCVANRKAIHRRRPRARTRRNEEFVPAKAA